MTNFLTKFQFISQHNLLSALYTYSNENIPILALSLVRNVPDFRIFGTMQEFSIPALFQRQIMREFVILALFRYEIGRQSYSPQFSSSEHAHIYVSFVRVVV